MPDGAHVELQAGAAALTIAQVGASLRRLTIDGGDALDGYGDQEIAAYAQGQALVPWPNRLADGRYAFGDQELQLPLSEPEKHNAIHGLARWAAWEVTERSADRATVAYTVPAQAGYPFTLRVEVTYELAPEGLTVHVCGENAGERALPFGLGFHPYLTVGTASIDDAELELAADARLESDDRGIPTGRSIPVAGSQYDFTARRRIGDVTLDTAFTGLRRDGAGRAHRSLPGPGGRALRLWMDGSFRWVMAFTGDSLPDPARRRRALGVEPMTCPPNALQTGEGVIVLEPAERHACRWGLTWDA